MKNIVMTVIVSLLLLSKLSLGYVLNYGFLDDTAGVYFNDKDWEMFYTSELRTLNYNKDGSKSQWRNPQTGSWGSFMPSHTLMKKGIRCRDLTIVNAANYRIGQSTLTFCKVNGDWKGI
jgi:hypothetical protein